MNNINKYIVLFLALASACLLGGMIVSKVIFATAVFFLIVVFATISIIDYIDRHTRNP